MRSGSMQPQLRCIRRTTLIDFTPRRSARHPFGRGWPVGQERVAAPHWQVSPCRPSTEQQHAKPARAATARRGASRASGTALHVAVLLPGQNPKRWCWPRPSATRGCGKRSAQHLAKLDAKVRSMKTQARGERLAPATSESPPASRSVTMMPMTLMALLMPPRARARRLSSPSCNS